MIPKIDLHMHSTVSDGTDTPEEILSLVRAEGIELFSVTDHDAILACGRIKAAAGPEDPRFLSGVELSCRDLLGKYHILGYGYDSSAEPICSLVERGHQMRIEKTKMRLDLLLERFGLEFNEEDRRWLFSNANPGKPHIANLMVQHGIAESIRDAFDRFLNGAAIPGISFKPEEAINAILQSGGIPVLAHPPYGGGDEVITGQEMDLRLKRLIGFGIQGVEAFYSGFTPKLQTEMLGLAEKYDLYVTAGSDYHGSNKLVRLGDTGLTDPQNVPEGLLRFLEVIEDKI